MGLIVRQFREYALLMIKSISHGVLVYACFFGACAIIFNIYLPSAFFFMGAFTSILSLIFFKTVYIKYQKKWDMAPAILIGVPYSAAVSIIYLLAGNHMLVSVLLFLYLIYLWKSGWNTSESGINYDLYKEQFFNGFKLLILLILISIMYGSEALSDVVSRFSIIYTITGPIILKNSREMQYVNTRRTKKSEILNMLTSVAVAILMLSASSNVFISCLLVFLKNLITVLDNILTIPVKLIGYVVGWMIMPLASWLLSRSKNSIPPEIININENKQLEEIEGIVIPYGIQIAIKLFVFIAVIYGLIKLYNVYASKKKTDDFSESREFVLSADQIRGDVKNRLSSFVTKILGKLKPGRNTLRGKIRFIYYNFLELSIKYGTYKSIDETPENISSNTSKLLKESYASLKDLTQLYQKTRYSPYEPGIEDYKEAERDFREIKERLAQNRKPPA